MELTNIILKAIQDVEKIEDCQLSLESKQRLVEDMNLEICNFVLAYTNQKHYLDIWHNLTDFQKQLLKNASSENGTSTDWWDDNKVRQAQELVSLGYLSVEPASRGNRADIYYLKVPGRAILRASKLLCTTNKRD